MDMIAKRSYKQKSIIFPSTPDTIMQTFLFNTPVFQLTASSKKSECCELDIASRLYFFVRLADRLQELYSISIEREISAEQIPLTQKKKLR